jgi:general secretion pathway protein L
MTLQNILNADLATIGRWLHAGFVWWIDELSGLVPERYRRNVRRRAPWTARVDRDGVIQLWREGRPTQATPPSPAAGWRADVVLPTEAVLVRDLDLPRLSNADLRRMLQVNMDRFTPFSAERVYFDAPTLLRPGDEARARVRLAVIPRERALDVLTRARALGLEVERLGTEDEDSDPAFDFMAAIRADQGGSSGRRRLALWWSACAGLVALNVLAIILLDMRDVRRLTAAVETEQPRVAAATRIRETVAAEQGVRLALLTRRSQNEPLRIVDALTKALPEGQWTHRLEWNGRTVRIVGFKTQGFDVPGALRHTPALTNPRSLLSDMPVKTTAGVEPFDVIADSATRTPK